MKIFRTCVGCKNENTEVLIAVECSDGDKRHICQCHFCGGTFFLPSKDDLKEAKKKKCNTMDITSFLASLMRIHLSTNV